MIDIHDAFFTKDSVDFDVSSAVILSEKNTAQNDNNPNGSHKKDKRFAPTIMPSGRQSYVPLSLYEYACSATIEKMKWKFATKAIKQIMHAIMFPSSTALEKESLQSNTDVAKATHATFLLKRK